MANAIEIKVELFTQPATLEDLTPAAITDLTGATITLDERGWEDITADVILPINIRMGIRNGTVSGRVARPGSCTFSLDNSEFNSASTLGYYSPGHASVRTDWSERRKVRVGIRATGGSTWRYIFTGTVFKITPSSGTLGRREVEIEAKDYMQQLQAFVDNNRLELLTDATSDQGYSAVLATITAQPQAINWTTGIDIVPAYFHKMSNSPTAYSEIVKIALSGFEYVWVDGTGTLQNQVRDARLNDTTVQFTLSGNMTDVTVEHSNASIPDIFKMKVYPMRVSKTVEQIFELGTAQQIEPGETISFIAKYEDSSGGRNIGATEVVTTIDNDDLSLGYHAEDLSGTFNADATVTIVPYGASADVTVTNGSTSQAWLSKLLLRGKPIRTYNDITKEAATGLSTDTDLVSTTALQYAQNATYAEAAANMAVNVYGQAWPRAVSVLLGQDATMLTNVLTKGYVGNRIRVIESLTAVDHEVFINGISWKITNDEDVEVTFTLAPTRPSTAFIVGTSRVGTGTVFFSGG